MRKYPRLAAAYAIGCFIIGGYFANKGFNIAWYFYAMGIIAFIIGEILSLKD